MKSRRIRLEEGARAAYQRLDDFLAPVLWHPQFVPAEPLGGNGANAVLIVSDSPISAPLAREIVQDLDDRYPTYTVRMRRG